MGQIGKTGLWVLTALLVTAVCGCASETPEYRESEEAGWVRCGYEDNAKMEGPIRCDMISGQVCCALGGRLEDRSCMTREECEEEQEKNPGMTNNQECDESSDCRMKYGLEKPWCCAPWKDKITECRQWADCKYEDAVTYVNCLMTWNCPPGTVCIENDFVPDLWYCDPKSYDGPDVDIYEEPEIPSYEPDSGV